MDAKTILVALVTGIAGVGSGYFGAETYKDLSSTCQVEKDDLRDALNDSRDSLRMCTQELLSCDPRAGRLMLREGEAQAAPPAMRR